MCFSYYFVHSEGRTVACVDWNLFICNAVNWISYGCNVGFILVWLAFISIGLGLLKFLGVPVLTIFPYPSYLYFPTWPWWLCYHVFWTFTPLFEWRGKLSRINHAYCYTCFRMQFLYIYLRNSTKEFLFASFFPMEFSFFVSRVYYHQHTQLPFSFLLH